MSLTKMSKETETASAVAGKRVRDISARQALLAGIAEKAATDLLNSYYEDPTEREADITAVLVEYLDFHVEAYPDKPLEPGDYSTIHDMVKRLLRTGFAENERRAS